MAHEFVDVVVSHRYIAPAQQVYAAWLDPDTAGRWLFATPAGRMTQVEIDARVGGRFRIVEERGGIDAVHRGEYVELLPPQRLAFRFFFAEDDQANQATVVRIEISPLVIGGCMLTLTHERVPAQQAQQTRKGWTQVLTQLAAVLGGQSEATG